MFGVLLLLHLFLVLITMWYLLMTTLVSLGSFYLSIRVRSYLSSNTLSLLLKLNTPLSSKF